MKNEGMQAEVYSSGLVFKVWFTYYQGRPATMIDPEEYESIEINSVSIWDKSKKDYIDADNLIDDWDTFQESVEQQLFDYMKQ